MRPLRWKSKYRIDVTAIDNRNRALVDTLNEVAAEANRVEHCQDLNDFFNEITTAAGNMLNQLNESTSDASGDVELFENELRRLLESKLPLAARGTPACTDCCICSLLEKRTRAWLGDAFANQAQCEPESNQRK